MTFTQRALLAVALLVGFYALAILVVTSIVFGIYELATHAAPGALVAKVGLVGGVAILAIVRGLLGRRPGRDVAPLGVLLPEDLQPRLWAQAREIATLAQTRAPDEIRLVAEVNAAVTEDARWLGLRRGTRRLFIGVPLLVGLDHQQVRAVLAHEFGHYSGRHTALAGVSYRGQEAIGRILDRMHDDSLAARPFRLYGRLYLLASQSVNRRQELEADLLGAEIVGARTTATTLEQIERIGAAWCYFLDEYICPGTDLGSRPDDLFERFSEFWCDRSTQHRVRADTTRASLLAPDRAGTTMPYDSHPPTAVRVAALLAHAARAPRAEPSGGGPALDLLRDARPVLAALQDTIFDETLAARPLAEVVPVAALQTTRASARRLQEALAYAGRPGGLSSALDVVQDGSAADVLRPWAPYADDETLRHGAAMRAADLAAQRLVDDDRARFVLAWPSGRTLDGPDGARLDPWTAAFVAVDDPRRSTALSEWVAAHGVRLQETPDELAAAATPTRDHPGRPPTLADGPLELLAVATPVSGKGVKTVYVTTHGIALEDLGFWESVRVFGSALGSTNSKAMRARALGRDLDRVVMGHRTTWVPWASSWGVDWKAKALGRGVLRIRPGDGSTRKIVFSSETLQEGEVIGAIRHLLGDRFSTR